MSMGVLRTNQYSNESFFVRKPLATKMCLCFRQVVTAKLNENVNCNQEYNNEILFCCFFQTSHKKTFFYLEQLILKHGAHQNTVKVKQESGKTDIYFKI